MTMLAFAPFGFPLPEFLMLVLGFGFLIFVHELGHFAVAKWVGIRCPQFAIGFGQALVSWRQGIGLVRGSTEREYERRCIDKLKADGVEPEELVEADGKSDADTPTKKRYSAIQIYGAGDALGLAETEYRLNYLPLGGYVKMMGQEDMDPNARSEHPNAYNNKPIWARACVISAGVVMNMIFGAIFLTIAFMVGVTFPSATVGDVIPGMPAATTFADGHDGDLRYLGLREGDVIQSVNGKTPEDFKDVAIAVALGTNESTVELAVERRGFDEPLLFKLQPERQKTGEKMLSAGFSPGYSLDVAFIKDQDAPMIDWFNERTEAVPTTARGEAEGFRITAVDGKAIETYGEYLLAFDESNGEPVAVTFGDNTAPDASAVFEVAALPTLVRYPDKPANLLGLVPAGKVTFVDEGSPAEEAGLKEGDILVQAGPLVWPSDTTDIAELIGQDLKAAHKIVVLRDGEQIDLGEVKPSREGKLGIAVRPALDEPVIAQVLEGSAAATAFAKTDGFIAGTRLVDMGGQPIEDWAEIQRTLLGVIKAMEEISPNDPALGLTFKLALPVGEGEPTEEIDILLSELEIQALAAAGWQPDHSAFLPLSDMTLLKADGLGDAMGIGLDKTQDFVVQTYITLLRLIQGNVRLENLRGPVGIIDTGTTIAKRGFPYLLFFLGLISINLAVINFLPIPIVDGGHMVFLAWEKLTGSPPNEKVQAYALYAGLMVIGFVFIATFYYDVMRLITRIF